MASSIASYDAMGGAREAAGRGVEQSRKLAEIGMFGLREVAGQTVGQAREVLDNMLSTTQRSAEAFDRQAADVRRSALALTSKAMVNGLKLAEKLLQAQSPVEVIRLQAEFARSQMNVIAEHTRELSDTLARTASDAVQTATESAQQATDWSRIQGNWQELKRKAKEKWDKLTDEELDEIDGRRDRLEARIQHHYGHGRDQVRTEISAWQRGMRH